MAVKIKQSKLQHHIKSTPTEDCGDGRHNEILAHPDVPEGEETVEGRLAKMREIHQEMDDRGDPRAADVLHEINAAAANVKRGHISSGDEISRPLSEEETARNEHGESQSVKAVCQNCHKTREIDHGRDEGTPGNPKIRTGETKNRTSISPGGAEDRGQLLNNCKMAAEGGNVHYKTRSVTRTMYKGITETLEGGISDVLESSPHLGQSVEGVLQRMRPFPL